MRKLSRLFGVLLAVLLLLNLGCASFASSEEVGGGSAVIDADTVITERTAFPDGLIIEDASVLETNETYSYTLTVDGIETEILSGGVYEGYCVITPTLADTLSASGPGGDVTENYRSAIYIDSDGVNEDYSVLDAVQTDEDSVLEQYLIQGVVIQSNDSLFNGIKVVAEGYDVTYVIDDVTILLTGIGGDDFRGYGAGIYVQGDTNVLISNSYIENRGCIRAGIVVGTTAMSGGGSPVVNIENTVVYTHSSDFDEWQAASAPMMNRIPFVLGSTGNVRATVALGTSEAHYTNCIVVSESWGVISTL